KDETAAQQFPAVLNAGRVIERLRGDHDLFMRELAKAVALTREARSESNQKIIANKINRTAQLFERVKQRLAEHNVTEESQIYRWLSRLINEKELAKLESEIRVELANRPARFSDTEWVA